MERFDGSCSTAVLTAWVGLRLDLKLWKNTGLSEKPAFSSLFSCLVWFHWFPVSREKECLTGREQTFACQTPT